MRDLVLASILFYGIVRGAFHPWIGIMFWTWVSIMSPHKLSWALTNQPVAFAVAVSILVGLIITRDKRKFVVTSEVKALFMFMFWILCVTYPMSIYMDKSHDLWNKVWKVDLMILVAIALLHTRAQIITLVWVIAFSIGFYGFKGGLFTLATGGSFKIWGPEGSWIEGNNEIALAMVITIPLIRFLQLQIPSKRGKQFCSLWMALTAIAALGSHSRGALLAIGAMAFVMWLRSEKKGGMGVYIAIGSVFIMLFMPKEWTERMHTVETYDKDASAMGRINAWIMCYRLALDHPFVGGGFSIYEPSLFALYAPDPLDLHVAHSIYFSVLGEHGFVGLFLFINLWWQVWRSAGKLHKEERSAEPTRWVADLAAMCQVSLAGYAVGGAFLSLAYFDLPYNVLVLIVVSRRWVHEKGWETEPPLTGRLAPLWGAMGVGRRK